MRIGFIISLLFAILVALFGIQNAAVISVNFFSTKFYISLALIIFVSAIIGAIVVTLFGLQKEFTLSRGNKRLTKKADNFQSEIEMHKNENVALTIENETFKNKTKDLETKTKDLEAKIEALEAKLEASETNIQLFVEEITALKIEIDKLNTISSTETIILK